MAVIPQVIRQPPSSVTGELGGWLSDVAGVLNNTPQMSYFSGVTPESVLTGRVGNLAVNVGGSGATDVRLYLKGGTAGSAPSTAGWTALTPGSVAAGFVTSVSGTAGRISVSGTTAVTVDISSLYAGQSTITTIGTLVAGAVPASLVTAGTFGAGDYVFPSDLTVTDTLVVGTDPGGTNPLRVGGIGQMTRLLLDDASATAVADSSARRMRMVVTTGTSAYIDAGDSDRGGQIRFRQNAGNDASVTVAYRSGTTDIDGTGVIFTVSPTGLDHAQWGEGNLATTGQQRFANNVLFGWRNAGNTANHTFGLNTADLFVINTGLRPSSDNAFQLGLTGERWSAVHATRITSALLGTATAVDTVLDRNSVAKLTLGNTVTTSGNNTITNGNADFVFQRNAVTQLTLGSLVGTFAGALVIAGTLTGVTSGSFSTRVTSPLLGTTTAVDVVLDRNSVAKLTLGNTVTTHGNNTITNGNADFVLQRNAVTQLTLGSLLATFAGDIRTAAPSGGTAANWKLGTVAAVSPTAQNRTIEVEVGGTTYYLTAKTTND